MARAKSKKHRPTVETFGLDLDELLRKLEADKPNVDELLRKLEADKPDVDELLRKQEVNKLDLDELIRKMEANKPDLDKIFQRIKAETPFDFGFRSGDVDPNGAPGNEATAKSTPAKRSQYETLGLLPHASDDQIKRTFKVLVLKNHPDKFHTHGAEAQARAAARLKEIMLAYTEIMRSRAAR